MTAKTTIESPPSSGTTVAVDDQLAARVFYKLAEIIAPKSAEEAFGALALACAVFCDQGSKATGRDLRTWFRRIVRDAPTDHHFILTPEQLAQVIRDE